MLLLTILQVTLAILLSLSILAQHRTSGLSAAFGGSGVTYVQRRGAEKVLYLSTIWMSTAFFSVAVIRWFL